MRSFESPACGAFTLSQRTPELSQSSSSEGERARVLRMVSTSCARRLRDGARRPRHVPPIAAAGFERVRDDTYTRRASTMLQTARTRDVGGAMTGIADAGDDARQPPGAAPNVSRSSRRIPIQYQAPLFRALGASGVVEPTVYFGSRHGVDVAMDAGFGHAFRWDVPLLDGYEHVFLPNTASKPDVSRFRRRSPIGRRRGARPGQSRRAPAARLADLRARANAESRMAARTARDRPRRVHASGARRAAARAAQLIGPSGSHSDSVLYRAAFERVDAFLVIGSRNRDYYRSFGVPDEKFFWAPYGVDNDWFSLSRASARPPARVIRSSTRCRPDTLVFASSAKLIARKRPLDLVDAVAEAAPIAGSTRTRCSSATAKSAPPSEARATARWNRRRHDDRGFRESGGVTGVVRGGRRTRASVGFARDVGTRRQRGDGGRTAGRRQRCGRLLGRPRARGENGFTYPCGNVARTRGSPGSRSRRWATTGRAQFGSRSREIVARFGIDVAAPGDRRRGRCRLRGRVDRVSASPSPPPPAANPSSLIGLRLVLVAIGVGTGRRAGSAIGDSAGAARVRVDSVGAVSRCRRGTTCSCPSGGGRRCRSCRSLARSICSTTRCTSCWGRAASTTCSVSIRPSTTIAPCSTPSLAGSRCSSATTGARRCASNSPFRAVRPTDLGTLRIVG